MNVLDFDSFVPGASKKTGLLDATLLVLHIAGRVDLSLLQSFKRVKSNFTQQDVILLNWILTQFREILTTSYILTEVSNLGNSLSGRQRNLFYANLASYAVTSREAHVSTTQLGAQSETVRFGFADSALCQLCRQSVIITSEYRLSGYLADQGKQVLNFNNLRPLWMT